MSCHIKKETLLMSSYRKLLINYNLILMLIKLLLTNIKRDKFKIQGSLKSVSSTKTI